ncbi:MAG: hypothetical protein HC905_16010 [Bacteroidales bacterium]|nr:hypothetical protein [Bacteroidales bacterium]
MADSTFIKSERRGDNSWSKAINLGSAVNTQLDEKNPGILNNGKQLSFSSQGHLNMGGFDLFYIDYPVQNTSKPRNFGFPLNTVNDDLSFYPVQNQKAGFISKHDKTGQGETDIFRAVYSSLSNFSEINVKTMLEISGTEEGDTISLYLVDTNIKDTISKDQRTPGNQALEYTLYPGTFTLIAQNKQQEPVSASFSVPENADENAVRIPLSISLKKQKNLWNGS